MTNKCTAGIFAALLCLLSLGVANIESRTNDGYDGKWWLSIGKKQREGFIDGYIACYSYDVRGLIRFAYESGQTYAPRLTDYLSNHPEEEGKPVEQTLWKIAKPPYAPPPPKHHGVGSGPNTGKYGGYDGEFWREVDNSKRLGFVQGFLYCYEKNVRGIENDFPSEGSVYVKAISNWYGIDENDEGAIDAKRAGAKIPDVLLKFRGSKRQ